MFETRANQISDLYSRDYNGKATVNYYGSNAPKETFITDQQIPNYKTMVNIEKNIDSELYKLDAKQKKDYNVDPRIFELERNAEAAYIQWKNEQERIKADKTRDQALKESLGRLKAEKDQLQETIKRHQQNHEKHHQDFNPLYYQTQKQNEPEFQNQMRNSDHFHHQPKQKQFDTPVKSHQRFTNSTASSGFGPTTTIKAHNDDFNFRQADPKMTTSSPWKNFHYHDEGMNYSNIDVEKLELASKHCAACEAKYKLILNTINPLKEKQRITDETMRKLLIHLKGLYMNKKFNEALDLLDSAFEDGYKHADLYYMAGEVHRALKNYKEAEGHYLQALTFQVHSPYVYQSLGLTYIHLNNHKRAIPLLKHFTDRITSDTSCFELGKCLAICKSYLEATVQFGKAIQINSKVGDYYLHRGDSYEALGFTKLALDDYRMFRELTPSYREVFEANIKDLEKQKKLDEASTFKAYLKKIEA